MTLSKEVLLEVLRAHVTYNGNCTEASKHLPCCVSSVRKTWKAKGLSTGKPGQRADGTYASTPSAEKISIILAAHETYGGNSKEAERNLPHASSTFRRHWRTHGLSIGKHGGDRRSENYGDNGVDTLDEGIIKSEEVLDSGLAAEKLDEIVGFSNR